jgi:hypothetical protein
MMTVELSMASKTPMPLLGMKEQSEGVALRIGLKD